MPIRYASQCAQLSHEFFDGDGSRKTLNSSSNSILTYRYAHKHIAAVKDATASRTLESSRARPPDISAITASDEANHREQLFLRSRLGSHSSCPTYSNRTMVSPAFSMFLATL